MNAQHYNGNCHGMRLSPLTASPSPSPTFYSYVHDGEVTMQQRLDLLVRLLHSVQQLHDKVDSIATRQQQADGKLEHCTAVATETKNACQALPDETKLRATVEHFAATIVTALQPDEEPAQTPQPRPAQPAPQPRQSNSNPAATSTTVYVSRFFASCSDKRLFKILSEYGEVVSMIRIEGRGFLFAQYRTAEQATAALQINGLWAKANRPGIVATLCDDSKRPRSPHRAEFVGSDAHQRMAGPNPAPRRLSITINSTRGARVVHEHSPALTETERSRRPAAAQPAAAPKRNNTNNKPEARPRPERQAAHFFAQTQSSGNDVPAVDNAAVRRQAAAEPGAAAARNEEPNAADPRHAQAERALQKPATGGERRQGAEAPSGREDSDGRQQTQPSQPTFEDRPASHNSDASIDEAGNGSATARRRAFGGGAEGGNPSTDGQAGDRQKIQDEYEFNGTHWMPSTKKLDIKLQAMHPPRKCQNVRGDGNCLWLAVIKAGKLKYATHNPLKRDVLKFAQANKKQIQQALQERYMLTGDTLDADNWWPKLEHELTTDGAYADETSILIMAFFLQIDLRIFDIDDNATPQTIEGQRPWSAQSGRRPIIEVAYRRHLQLPMFDADFKEVAKVSGHYWAIIKQGNPLPSATGRR